jgi:[protein-PII] uridylyltransferase
MGFDDREVTLVGGLVRRHLLLAEVATTRDLADPATVAYVVERVPDPEMLDILEVLTEADARATSPQAWTSWRAGLVGDLTRRVRRELAAAGTAAPPGPDEATPRVEVSDAVRADPRRVDVRLRSRADGTTLTVVSGDRVGLMADVAGALALQRVPVRSARAWAQDDLAVSVWELDDPSVDEAVLRQRVEGVAAGREDPAARLRGGPGDGLDPSVQVRYDASRRATVLEVRVANRPGVVHRVCAALAGLSVTVRSAHLATLGPQAVDVFYVQEPGAGVLSDERAAAAVHAVRRALQDPVTLDADRG